MSYNANKNDYNLWLSQPMIIGSTRCERRFVVHEFAVAVRKWMKTLGYTMEHRMDMQLSVWIYRLYVQEIARKKHGQPVWIPEPEHRNTQDDFDQYNMVVDHDAVTDFMSEWSNVQDMDVNSIIGYRIWYGIQEFLYSVIDLESSKQGRLIARIWDNSGSNSDSEIDYKKDIYVEEAKEGRHGGRGSKV
jgi:hypothetical protein